MDHQIVFAWPGPPWLVVVLLLLLTAVIIWSYGRLKQLSIRRRVVLGTLRWLTMLLVALAAMDWKLERYRTDLPDLLIVVDSSRSMAEKDGLEGVPTSRRERWRRATGASPDVGRFEMVRQALDHLSPRTWRRLEQHHDVQFVAIDERMRRLRRGAAMGRRDLKRLSADGSSSPIGDRLRDLMVARRGTPTAAIICFTDGAVTSGLELAEAAGLAERQGIPLRWIGLGSAQPVPDLAIEEVIVEDTVFLDDLVRFDVRLRATALAGQPIDVRIVPDVDHADPVESRRTVPADRENLVVRLWVRATRPGKQTFRIEASTETPERDRHNNRKTVTVTVKDQPLRVLLVAERPSWEFRAIKERLERAAGDDPSRPAVALSSVLQEADPEYAEQDDAAIGSVPVARDRLDTFDVIVLCEADLSLIGRSTMENMRSVVESSGTGLVVVAGPRHWPDGLRGTPLESILPMEIDAVDVPRSSDLLREGEQVEPTPVGRLHPALQITPESKLLDAAWRQLPGIRWWSRVGALRGGTQVLLRLAGDRERDRLPSPLLVSRYAGKGQVVCLLTDESYRWAHGPRGDRPFDQFWMQLLRELGRRRLQGEGRRAVLSTDRTRYRTGDPVRVRLRFADPPSLPAGTMPQVEVVRRDGRRTRHRLRAVHDDPREFAGTIPFLPPGRYRIESAGTAGGAGKAAAVEIEVASQSLEALYRRRDQAALQAAAQLADHHVYEVDQIDAVLRAIPRGTPVRLEPLPGTTLWNRSWSLLLVVGLLATEWILRKAWGLA